MTCAMGFALNCTILAAFIGWIQRVSRRESWQKSTERRQRMLRMLDTTAWLLRYENSLCHASGKRKVLFPNYSLMSEAQ